MQGLQGKFDFESLGKGVLDNLRQVVEEYPQSGQAPAKPGALEVSETEAFWQAFDLSGKRSELQQQVDQIHAARRGKQAAADSGRRLDVAETGYLNLATALLEAPDPLPVLQGAAMLVLELEEAEKRQAELEAAAAAASKDDAEVNQLLAKLHTLEAANLGMKQQLDSQAGGAAQLEETKSNLAKLQSQEQQLRAELQQLQTKHNSLQAEHSRAQDRMFEALSQREEQQSVKQQDSELAAADMERAQQHIRALQAERDQLRARVDGATEADEAHTSVAVERARQEAEDAKAALRLRLREAEQQHQVWDSVEQALRQKLLSQEEMWAAQVQSAIPCASRCRKASRQHQVRTEGVSAVQEEQQQLRARVAGLVAESSVQQVHLQEATELLAQQPRAEEVTRLQERVAALQSMVDSQMEAEGWEAEGPVPMDPDKLSPANLHKMMQARNRKLAAEVTRLRNELQSSTTAAGKLEGQVQQLMRQGMQQKQLISQLEEDLLASSHSGGRSAAQQASPELDASLSSEAPQPSGSEASVVPPTDSDSLLSIVTNQRNRLRQRVSELEEQLGTAQASLQTSKAAVSALKADNISLYEKIRYLQRYKKQAQGGPMIVRVDSDGLPQQEKAAMQHRMSCGPFQIGLAGQQAEAAASSSTSGPTAARRRLACFGAGDDEEDLEAPRGGTEGAYSKAYQAQLNPFVQFQQKESERSLNRVALHDRAILSGSKVLLANRLARIFVTVYATLLHVFVFALIYYSAFRSSGPAKIPG